jgi:hypothetical protein
MTRGRTDEAQSAKERLESAFALLQIILERRLATEDPGFAWGIERGIIGRELRELEADLLQPNSLPVSG